MKSSISGMDSLVVFRNSQEVEGRGTLMHLTRNRAVFEVYNPYSIVQLSEVLSDVRVLRGERTIYSGRAVVSSLVATGLMLIVSATLVDPWSDLVGLTGGESLRREVTNFVHDWESTHALRPSYQLAVSTIRAFLGELSRWLGQAEAMTSPGAPDSVHLTREFAGEVEAPLQPKLHELFERFEAEASQVPEDAIEAHKAFARREIHPLTLCSPFVYRTYTKPLGYAGDYEMVNMILRDPVEGPNVYAKIVNAISLRSGTAVAHRNRIRILGETLEREAGRASAQGRLPLRVLNVGCGPAKEVENFIRGEPLSERCQFTLMDFNQETIEFAKSRLFGAAREAGRNAEVQFVHRSVHDLLREAAGRRSSGPGSYDVVYCAGLFDYLSDRICKALLALFYEWVVPGGLVLATNVHTSNPIRYFMEHLMEWYLIYRDERALLSVSPSPGESRVFGDPTGVNIFLETRKGGLAS